tara:strand:- start:61 stop:624 length:564 start_codon:yes stop_codon:yes gene_type:complete
MKDSATIERKTVSLPTTKPRLLVRKGEESTFSGMLVPGKYVTDGSVAIRADHWPGYEKETNFRFPDGRPEGIESRNNSIDGYLAEYQGIRPSVMPALVPAKALVDSKGDITHVLIKDGGEKYGFGIRYWNMIHNTLGLSVCARPGEGYIRSKAYPICNAAGKAVGVLMPADVELSGPLWDHKVVDIA